MKIQDRIKTKGNKGITLIALVITIIVLLILAGVTISTLMGNSGITSNASLSKMMNELSKYKEEVELYKANKIVDHMNQIIKLSTTILSIFAMHKNITTQQISTNKCFQKSFILYIIISFFK